MEDNEEGSNPGTAVGMPDKGISGAVASGNVELSMANALTMQLPEGSMQARKAQEEALAQAEMRRKMRQTVVPTDDGEVRALLRRLGEPITLFGEREMERRNRLRVLLARMDDEGIEIAGEDEEMEEAGVAPKELFYTEGIPELEAARKEILRFSLRRADQRLAGAKRKAANPDEDEAAERSQAEAQAARTVQVSSEVGDNRPVGDCAFSPEGSLLATSSWGGRVKIWSAPECREQKSWQGHDSRITGLAWHPEAQLGQGEDSVNLATGALDCSARLWSLSGKLLGTLEGHTDRLGRVAFHPMGRHLGTASFDHTWRLWDLETGVCLQEQEGHSREVYTLAFHPDGSLAASGGMDGIGRVWDLRSGRSILVLEGHVQGVLAADFSPNGYHLCTGSKDHTCRIWDLRARASLYTITGHTSLIPQVRYDPGEGHVILTAGYDNAAKLWSATTFKFLKNLPVHEGKVMGADISPDGSGLVCTVSYDRTIKLWEPAQEEFIDEEPVKMET